MKKEEVNFKEKAKANLIVPLNFLVVEATCMKTVIFSEGEGREYLGVAAVGIKEEQTLKLERDLFPRRALLSLLTIAISGVTFYLYN